MWTTTRAAGLVLLLLLLLLALLLAVPTRPRTDEPATVVLTAVLDAGELGTPDVLLQRVDVACDREGECAWRVLEELREWPAAMLCVAHSDRWHRYRTAVPLALTRESVVRAYLAGPDVFAALPVWWDAVARRPCVLGVRGASAAAVNATSHQVNTTSHQVIFALEYDNATTSLQPARYNATLNDEIAHGRNKAVLLVLPAAVPPSPASDLQLPWGRWHPGPRWPPPVCVASWHFKGCRKARFGVLAEPPLRDVRLPDSSWVWAEPASSSLLGAADRPWPPACGQRVELFIVGDSLAMQLSELLGFTRSQPDDACSARPLPRTLPHNHFKRVYQLQNAADLNLYRDAVMQPRFKLKEEGATPVLVLSSGLWNLKYNGTVPQFRAQLRTLLDEIEANSTFPRAVFMTAATVQVLHKESFADKVRMTSTRVAAVNAVVRDLFAARAYKRIALLDVAAPSLGALWASVPDDGQHYCSSVIYTHMALLLRHLCGSE